MSEESLGYQAITDKEGFTIMITQKNLCKAITFWLQNRVGIQFPLEVTSVRTLVNPGKPCEIKGKWRIDGNGSTD
jgi:hypothetical protein